MLFNTANFLLFFLAFFALYWFAFSNRLKMQNMFLLAGSYLFYALWDYHFLLLIILNSLFSFIIGQKISTAKQQKTKNRLTTIGIVFGIGQLFYFKYFNFFIGSFASLLHINKFGSSLQTLNILLPLGISFYTFKIIGYLIDVKNKKTEPVTDWVAFFAYVAFFPCIISGPIDKSKTLIPQLQKSRNFNYPEAVDALKQIGWGLYKKAVIADNLSPYCDRVFDHTAAYSGSTLILGAICYSIQIYADFSGYSDMAIGISKLLGFTITRNFDYPFFALNVAQFWRKWHISLTQWLNEYVFTPLAIAFRDYGKLGVIMAVFINLIVIGFWHGANWTYGAFGLIHAIYFIPLVLTGKANKSKKLDPNKLFPSLKELGNILLTFFLVTFAFIFFRADSLTAAFFYINRIASMSTFHTPEVMTKFVIPFILLFILIEWLGRSELFALARIGAKWPLLFAGRFII